MPDSAELAEFVRRVGAFHIVDRAMRRAQKTMEAALHDGSVDAALTARYFDAVRHYFGGFEREARTHLREVDRRLEHINQVHFNLSAERGVAVKRIEATQGVLHDLQALEPGKT